MNSVPMRHLILTCLALSIASAQVPARLKPYVKYSSGTLVLDHVRVIDGTGAAPLEDMRISIQGGKILEVRKATDPQVLDRTNATIVDMNGKTVIPGLVGMHEHLFYPVPGGGADRVALWGEMADSAPRALPRGGSHHRSHRRQHGAVTLTSR